jgi:hypothetical protein
MDPLGKQYQDLNVREFVFWHLYAMVLRLTEQSGSCMEEKMRI